MSPQDAEVAYAGRLLDRQGIAMVLAVVDETGTGVPVTDERVIADGAAQAALLCEYRAALRPDSADDDAEAVQDVVAVFAHTDRPA